MAINEEDFIDLDEMSEMIDEELISEDDEYELLPDSQKKIYYLYELKKLFKQKENALITFSPNSVNLLIVEKEEYLEIKGWVPEADSFEYLTKQSVSNVDGEIDIVQKNEQTFYSYLDIKGLLQYSNGREFRYQKNRLYLMSPIKITQDEDILNYSSFVQSLNYEDGLTDTRSGKKIFKLVDLETWTTKDGNQAIIRIGQQLTDFKFDKLKLTSPSSFLLDSVKLIGFKNGELTSPVITMSNDLMPLWMNPIEKNSGELNFLNYWMSDNIFSLEKIWELGSLDEIYLNKLLPTDKDHDTETVTKTFYDIQSAVMEVENFVVVAGVQWGNEIQEWNFKIEGKNKIELSYENVLNNFEPLYGPSPGHQVSGYRLLKEKIAIDEDHGIDQYTLRAYPEKINNIIIAIKEKSFISSLYELLKEVLTASYNYNNNFKGAGYIDDDPQKGLNKMAIYKQEFESKSIVDYISGIEKAWEKKNATLMNDPIDKIYYQNYKIIKSMLSGYLYGNNSFANGGIDDYKFLLPWYFELNSKPIWNGPGKEDDGNGKWEYSTDLIVKLNSSYFNFDILKKIIILKNNIISEKQILTTVNNSWFWPTIPETIEETQLPSLNIVDFKLSDDNVGKFLVYEVGKNKDNYGFNNNLFKSSLNKIQKLNEFIPKSWELNLDLDIPKEISLSGLYGSGIWEIEFFYNDISKIKISNLQLFKINKQDIGKMKIVL